MRFGAADGARPRQRRRSSTSSSERGAFTRDSATGRYRVDFPQDARRRWTRSAAQILELQGDGDYAGVRAFMAARSTIAPELQADLERLGGKGIPVDVVFEQGPDVLGLGR